MSSYSDTPAQEKFFRGYPISWVTVEKTKEIVIEAAFGDDMIEKRPYKHHYIKYCDKLYRRNDFMEAYFSEYKKYPYKVKFKTDDIFLLSGNQRAKLQYHILSLKYPLVEVDIQDELDLRSLCCGSDFETAQIWYNRMQWEKGIEKMVTFGVSLGVPGIISDVWCYRFEIDDLSAVYESVSSTWEEWLGVIAGYIDSQRHIIQDAEGEQRKARCDWICDQAMIKLYYQDGIHLTLPARETAELKRWIYDYCYKGQCEYPYHGDICPAHYRFVIDFEKDVEIVEADDRKGRMKQYNEEHNAAHNKEMAVKKLRERVNALTGDEWTTQELYAQGISKNTLTRLVNEDLLRRVKIGYYERNFP